jgi:hypothetical protein
MFATMFLVMAILIAGVILSFIKRNPTLPLGIFALGIGVVVALGVLVVIVANM